MMKIFKKKMSAFMTLILGLVVWVSPVYAAGLLTPKNSNLPELKIEDHQVKVVIEDGYAITTINQTFLNPNGQDLEAIYSFPVPEKAAVSEFTMWIDGKPIHGEVLEKKKAREVYEDQKAQGKNTGLTEKNEYKTFEISVYPVRANASTQIRLSYIQPAHVDTSMGRYLYPLEDGGVDEQALAFWTSNDKVTGSFSFDLFLRSAYPIVDVRLPSHPHAHVQQNGDEWQVHLDNHMNSSVAPSGEDVLTLKQGMEEDDGPVPVPNAKIDSSFRLDTDIAVYYRHDENFPGAVDLVAYKAEGSKRGTFMLTVTPGMDLKTIQQGRDWVFILDISGSMKGKYATLAEGVSQSLRKMSVNDRFRIVLFNNNAREMMRNYVTASPENVKKYTDKVANVNPEGGTNVYAGLQLGLKTLDADRTSSLVLVTDGVANVGVTQQKEFVKLVDKHDVRLFTFIMGNSANRPLLEVLTRVSNGFAVSVSNSDDIIGRILEAQGKVNFQSLHDTQLKISGVKTADITPKALGSVYRGEQMIIFGHYFGSGKAKINLTGKISGEAKDYSTEFDFPDVSEDNPEVERLWAYSQIEQMNQEMDDFGETADIKQSITDLGVEYGLVTDYTSMLVVEEDVFQELGIERNNKKRIEKERQSQAHRQSQPVRSRRVDTQAPMFNNNRPTHAGGAGALDPISLAVFSPLLWGLRKKKKDGGQ